MKRIAFVFSCLVVLAGGPHAEPTIEKYEAESLLTVMAINTEGVTYRCEVSYEYGWDEVGESRRSSNSATNDVGPHARTEITRTQADVTRLHFVGDVRHTCRKVSTPNTGGRHDLPPLASCEGVPGCRVFRIDAGEKGCDSDTGVEIKLQRRLIQPAPGKHFADMDVYALPNMDPLKELWCRVRPGSALLGLVFRSEGKRDEIALGVMSFEVDGLADCGTGYSRQQGRAHLVCEIKVVERDGIADQPKDCNALPLSIRPFGGLILPPAKSGMDILDGIIGGVSSALADASIPWADNCSKK